MKFNDKKICDLIKYKPNKWQSKVRKSKVRFKVIVAGRRAGKTLFVAKDPLVGLVHYLFERDKNIWIVAPCVDEKTNILTKRGWLKYDELRVGDIVLTLNKNGQAEWQKCLKVNIYKKEGKVLSREFRGHSSLTTINHKWLVGWTGNYKNKRRIRGYRFSTEIKNNEFVLCAAKLKTLPKKKYSNSLVELVGWYWTEGGENGSGTNISQNRGKKANRIRSALLKEFGKPQEKGNRVSKKIASWTDWRKQNRDKNNDNGVFYLNKIATDKLKTIAPDKVIKPEFLTSLTQEQLELLIDVSVMADGHERKRDGYRERTIIQKRKDRLEMFQMAVQLAGYQSHLKYSKTRNIWVLHIFERNKIWLGQKNQRQKTKPVYYNGVVWCPTTKNGTWLARRNGTVYFTGNSYDLTERIWEEITRLCRRELKPLIKKIYNTRGQQRIVTHLGTVIEAKSADSPETLVGKGLDVLICDESAMIDEKAWNESLRPSLIDRKGVAIFIGTPKQKNWFYYMFLKGQDPANKEYESWQISSFENEYIDKEELEKIVKDMPELEYKQEIKADFLQDFGQVFRDIRKNVRNCMGKPEYGHRYILGVDFAKARDFTVITIVDRETNQVKFFDRFKEMDYNLQKPRVEAVARRYNNALIVGDGTGVGTAVMEDLKLMGLRVKPFIFSSKSKPELIKKLMIAIEESKIFYPDIPELLGELESFGKWNKVKGETEFCAPPGLHDDCVMSLALANWLLKNPTNTIYKEEDPYVKQWGTAYRGY